MNVRSNQGGSIASFIIIGVVLVVLTTGVLYWVRQRDTTVARESPAPEVSLPGSDTAKNDSKKESQPKKEENQDKPVPATQPSERVAAPAPAPAAQPEVTSLSQTGPADTALQLFAIGVIAIAGIEFVRSRNHSSLL